jgi:hypothetical protein
MADGPKPDSSPSQTRPTSSASNRPWRVPEVLAGLACFGGGVVTGFYHLAAYVIVPLFIAGVLFLVLGFTGSWISNFKISGGNISGEMKFEQQQRFAESVVQVADATSGEADPQLRKMANEMRPFAPLAADRVIKAIEGRASYEEVVSGMLLKVASKINEEMRRQGKYQLSYSVERDTYAPGVGGRGILSATITKQGGDRSVRLHVDVIYVTDDNYDSLRQEFSKLEPPSQVQATLQLMRQGGVKLVISNRQLDTKGSTNVKTLKVTGPADLPELTDVIRRELNCS